MDGQTEEESDDDSNNEREPKGAKSTVSSGDPTCYSIAHLGEKLYLEAPGFDLTDPNMHLVDNTYDCLHDVHLRQYFQKPKRKRTLIQTGFITAEEKVLYTRKEYHKYDRYRESVQLSWDKFYYEQQRKLMRDFLIMKEKGDIPPHIQISDMKEWLVHKGTDMHKHVYRSLWQSRNTGAMHLSQLRWEVNQRLKLESLEKEVRRELRMERRKLPLSQKTMRMKKSVECTPCPGTSGAGPRCLSSSTMGTSADLVFTFSTSLDIFSSPDRVFSHSSSEYAVTSPYSDSLSSQSEEGRHRVLLPDNERVICEVIMENVIAEIRTSLLPVLGNSTEISERSTSGSFRPHSTSSLQSRGSSSPPSSGPSSRTTMMVRPPGRASMHSGGAISPSTDDSTTESYIGTTFYTEVPMLCDKDDSSSTRSLIVSDTAACPVGQDTNSISSEEAGHRCVFVRPVANTEEKPVKMLGGMADDVADVDLDLEVELFTHRIIKAAAQHLSETTVINTKSVYTARGASLEQNSQKLGNSVAALLYKNICETENSRKATPYSSTQVTFTDSWCEMTRSQALQKFAEPLSQSAVDLLTGTFGEQAVKSLKRKKSEFELITKPTSERLLFVSHVNNRDLVVHKVAIEELSAEGVVKNIKYKDSSNRMKTPSFRPNTSGSARRSRRPSPTRQLLEAVVEKLVAKLAVRSMSVPEELNETACKQLEDPCNSPEGPLSEFHYQVASRLCPVLVSDIMESLSNDIVSLHDGESTILSPIPFTKDKCENSGAVKLPVLCVEKGIPIKDGSNTDKVELSSDSADIVRMAVTDIESGMIDSGKQNCSHLPPKTEVVVDIITKLVSDIESGTDSSKSLLTDVAVDMVVSTLDNLSEASSAASPNNLQLENTRPATAKIVSTVRKELEEQVGSTDALEQALISGSDGIIKAISSAVSREVCGLLPRSEAQHFASMSSSDSLPKSLDTTSSSTVRPLTAAVRPKCTFHPDCGLNPNHRSSSAMDRKPVVMVVHFDTVREIVSRLLVQLLPKGLNDFNLADCSLFDVLFEEFSSNIFVRVTRKEQKATVCLDSVEVTQVVLSVYTELVKLHDSPEQLQAKVFANCSQLFRQMSKLIVRAILRSPTRKPTAVEAKDHSDGPSQGTSYIPKSKWSLSVDTIEDILALLLTKMGASHIDTMKDGHLPQAVLGYLVTINIMDMTLDQLKALPGLALVDTEGSISDILKDEIASNVHCALSGKGITVESLYSAVQQGSSSALCIIRDEMINEIRVRCFSDDFPDVVKQKDQALKPLTTSVINQDEVRQVEFYDRFPSPASNTVDSLGSAIDKEKTPKRKSKAGRFFLRIFKGLKRSFTSCITPGQVKD